VWKGRLIVKLYKIFVFFSTVILLFCLWAWATASQPSPALPSYVPSQPIGNLDPEFSVNGNGSATAVIPIQVPPGTNGVAPKLSIAYDSHRANGYLGIGWAINGLSAISRCSANYRLDGYKAGVAYADTDRFCLDGRRLVVVNGSYGADSSVYHTESETWTIVTAHGRCGSGPCHFTATDKDGNTLSFGGTTGTSGSRILAAARSDGSVRTWAIDSFTDLNGNATIVEYSSNISTGEYYPTQIAYTQNTGAGLTANRFVTFNYTARPDSTERYLGGSKVTISKLLTSVDTSLTLSGQNQTILTYDLTYTQSTATHRSRLDSVQLCDGNDVCWPATQFDWSTDTHEFAPSTTNLPGPTYIIRNGQQHLYGVLMDFNGDGIADYSQATEFISGTSTKSNLNIYLGQADGRFVQAPYGLPDAIIKVTSSAVVQTGILIDINGDGVLDFSRALKNDDADTQDLDVYIGSDTGFTKDATYKLPGPLFWQVNQQTYDTGILRDMNGDGLVDYSRATKLLSTGQLMLDIYKGTPDGFTDTSKDLPGPVYSISATSGSLTIGTVRDINGDGIADYSAATVNSDAGTSDLKVYIGHSPDFTFDYQFDLPGQLYWQVNGRVMESGLLTDINGDGIADYSRATELLRNSTEYLDLYFGTGSGFVKAPFDMPDSIYVIDTTSSIQGMMTDWNGDQTRRFSKATKYQNGQSELDIFLGYGRGFESSSLSLPNQLFTVSNGQTYAGATYQDINGDGLTDFANSVCQLNGPTLTSCDLSLSLATGPYTDLMTGITNGFGGITTIDYAPLTEANVYTNDTASVYPLRTQSGAVYVVKHYTKTDGHSNSYSFDYKYSGAKTDLLGSGWVGFETVNMIQTADDRQSIITYDQTYPNYGQVKTSEIINGSGDTLTLSQYQFEDIADTAMQNLGIHQVLRNQEQITHYQDNTPQYTLQKNYSYDDYGNILITSDYGDISTSEDDVFTCARYYNSETLGQFGYWLQNKTTSTQAACQTFVSEQNANNITWNANTDLRWAKQTYDSSTQLVTNRSSYDNTHSQFLTVTFDYTDVGNLNTSTDSAGNTTRFAYDSSFQTYQTVITQPLITPTDGGSSYHLVTYAEHEPGFGSLIETTDPNGNVTSQSIDGFGRVVAVYGPDPSGDKTQLTAMNWQEASGEFYLLSQNRPDWSNDTVSSWPWRKDYQDAMGRAYRSVRNGIKNGVSTDNILASFIYDAEGRIHQSSAPYYSGDTIPYTTTEYDDYNRPILITLPDGTITKQSYAQGGLNITTIDGYGTSLARTTSKTINSRGRATQTIAANGTITNIAYNPISEMLQQDIVGASQTSAYTYDSLGRKLTVTRPDSGTVTKTYSPVGYQSAITNASGSQVEYLDYDGMGRLTHRKMTNDGGTQTEVMLTYDDPSSANGKGHLTTIAASGSTLGNFSYNYDYNAYGESTGGSFAIAGTRYNYQSDYDPVGRIIGAIYPNGAILSRTYGDDDNLSSVTFKDQGTSQAVEYVAYDHYTALGQYQTANYTPVSVDIEKSYFPVGPAYGQLKSHTATNSFNTTLMNINYGWDIFSDLTESENNVNSSHSQTYSYTDQAANKGMAYMTQNSGPFGTASFAYDNVGNINMRALDITASQETFTYTSGTNQINGSSTGDRYGYDANGNLTNHTIGSNTTAYTYDADGHLLSIDDGGSDKAQMVYNHAGNRIYFQDLNSAVKTWVITPYYEMSQLADNSFQTTTYIPGQDGVLATITTAISNSGAALPTVGPAQPSTPSSPTETAKFTLPVIVTGFLLGCLCVIAYAIGKTSQITSRAMRSVYKCLTAGLHTGWSMTKTVTLCFSLLVPTYAPVAHADLTPGANGPGVPVQGTQFYLTDHQGSVVTTLDDSGRQSASIIYDGYGEISQNHSTGTDNFRPKFVQGYYDSQAGLYNLGARYYNPTLTRFISPDPFNQFASPYLYAGNNPASAADPNGEFAFLTAMVIGIVVGAVVGAEFGGAAVNHDINPLHWDWKSGKTYAGLLGGAAIGAVGAAAGGTVVEAGVAIGATGGLAAEASAIAVGIAGEALVGAGENAAYTAMGGGSAKEILEAAGQGAAFGAAFAAAGATVSTVGSRLSREVASEESSELATGLSRGKNDVTHESESEISGGSCALRQSFVAGTPVLMADGSTKPIETINVGDILAGFDLSTETQGDYAVLSAFSRMTDEFVTVRFSNGTGVVTTPEHPFWISEKKWVPAVDITVDDKIYTAAARHVDVDSVQHNYSYPQHVYNFEIEDVENYFAGHAFALVHNGKFCKVTIDKKTGVVTETWTDSELKKRFPKVKEYQAIKRDIRFKARRSNWAIKYKHVKPFTRVKKPVKTASMMWVKSEWKVRFPGKPVPTSVRKALMKIRPAYAFANQDVDEFLTRVQGGLTIREGAGWNQGALNSFVNSTNGAAMGALSRRYATPVKITRFKVVIK